MPLKPNSSAKKTKKKVCYLIFSPHSLSSTFQCIILNLQAKASVFSSSELSEVLYFASMTPDQLASFIMNFDDYHLCVSPWRRDPDGKLSSSPQERLDLRSGMWSIVDGFGIDEHGVAEDDFQVLVHAVNGETKHSFLVPESSSRR